MAFSYKQTALRAGLSLDLSLIAYPWTLPSLSHAGYPAFISATARFAYCRLCFLTTLLGRELRKESILRTIRRSGELTSS
jgi:hypothetical protein